MLGNSGSILRHHHFLHTGTAHQIGVIRPTQMSDDMPAHQKTQLTGEVADPTAGACDQNAVTENSLAALQRIQRRQAGNRQGRCILIRHRIGNRREVAGRQGHLFCPALHAPGKPHHPTPFGRAATIPGCALHHAGQVPANLHAGLCRLGPAKLTPVERDGGH